MNKTRLLSSLSMGAIALSIYSCVDHNIPVPVPVCGTNVVSFQDDVQPIINLKCAIVGDGGCHNGGNGTDLNWTVFTNFQQRALEKKLQDRITRASGEEGKMPKIGSLTEDELQKIYCWAEQGAENN